jgi:signal transduction histidine kinase
MESKNIEKIFLSTLLQIAMVGVCLVLIADIILFPQDVLSIVIDSVILSACIFSYLIRQKHPTVSVMVLTSIVLLAMFYQCLMVPVNTTTSLSILLVEGFIVSVMLRKRLMWLMHGITFIMINVIFIVQFLNPNLRFSSSLNDLVTVAITYSILYFILTYGTGVLKFRYDELYQFQREANEELQAKTNEIEAQNEELTQVQDNLSALNKDLERLVTERTKKLSIKTEKLVQYSYTNAHDLRGPVARLMGLVAIQRMDANPDHVFFYNKIEEQAQEIDSVVRKINVDLMTAITDD